MSEPKTIVVVDDEPRICQSFEKTLGQEGYRVETFTRERAALDRILSGGADLVVSDLMMPEMTGVEILKAMNEARVKTPMVLITGYATTDNAMETMRLGAVDYLPKPFTVDELKSVVKRGLAAGEVDLSQLPQPPAGAYVIQYHSWAREEAKSVYAIGAHPFLLRCCGRIVGVELPMEEDDLMQGGAFGKLQVEGSRVPLRLWAPLSGDVIETNPLAETDPASIAADPYGAGWLIKVRPSNLEEELAGLVKR
ncbi:MAG: Transcriptional regulatory protein TcrA [candidate division BRC1 bacterium ADurb.BinA364]|nr:MAG: Transcriptional regulatory protein TcrA [candidate division BRC1 bacterium ADurb.BinA364]